MAAATVDSGNIVRLVDIRKTYVTGDLQVPVLKGIDATVARGEFVGFIGTSGSGKSTLLNILGMLDVPTGGNYFLEEVEVGRLTDVEQATIRNRKIGFIFQSFNLFPHLSVEENIEVPMLYARVPGRIRRKRALELAGQVGLGHRLGHRPTQLSGGECQRIAIARALSNSPAFILADEPTGNLDEKTSDEIMKLFHELNREQGVTMILTTHDMADIESLCSRVMLIGGGKKLLDGDISLLRKGREKRKLVCTLDRPPLQVELAEPGLEISLKQNRLEVQFSPENTPAARLIGEISEKYGILDMTLERTPIDRVVADMYAELAGGREA